MSERSAFDHRPDPELGRALRELLDAHGDEAFVQRVLAAAPGEQLDLPWWEVLTAWARPGLVAATGIAAGALLWFAVGGTNTGTIASLGDPLPAAGERAAVPSYLVSSDTPDVDAVMTTFVDND